MLKEFGESFKVEEGPKDFPVISEEVHYEQSDIDIANDYFADSIKYAAMQSIYVLDDTKRVYMLVKRKRLWLPKWIKNLFSRRNRMEDYSDD